MTYSEPSDYGYYYEGEWSDDAIHGSGTYCNREGKLFTGQWDQGCLNGVRYYSLK